MTDNCWIIDTRATSHIRACQEKFETLEDLEKEINICNIPILNHLKIMVNIKELEW